MKDMAGKGIQDDKEGMSPSRVNKPATIIIAGLLTDNGNSLLQHHDLLSGKHAQWPEGMVKVKPPS
jgi:hypothetical protein